MRRRPADYARRARIAVRAVRVAVAIGAPSATWGTVVDTWGGFPVAAQLWATLAVAEVTAYIVWSSIMRERIRELEQQES